VSRQTRAQRPQVSCVICPCLLLREGAVKPFASKDFWCPVYYKTPGEQVTKGWVNAYYLLTSDGVRLGGGLRSIRKTTDLYIN
jgi:hypothetical protein